MCIFQVPSYISRSVAGSYDNEAVAIFALIFTFFLYIKVRCYFTYHIIISKSRLDVAPEAQPTTYNMVLIVNLKVISVFSLVA